MSGKTGGLGVRKLIQESREKSPYDQEPEEPAPAVAKSTDEATAPASFRFFYAENVGCADVNSGVTDMTVHTFSLESSGTFVESVMDNGHRNIRRPSSSKPQEVDEARKKFPNAKSISSAQFFRDQEKVNDAEAKLSLQKFSTSTAISSDDLFGRRVNISLPILSFDDFSTRLNDQTEKDTELLICAIEEFKKKAASNVFSAAIDLWNKLVE